MPKRPFSWEERRQRRARQRKATRTTGFTEAPGDLAIVQAFVNTVADENHDDRLATAEDLGRWLERHGLLAAGTELDADQWARALDLRRDLRALIRAEGDAVDNQLLRSLERTAAGGRLMVRFDDGGPSSFGPASHSFDDALAGLLTLVALARINDQWRRLGICVRSGCDRTFFQTSMSRRAKWCTPRCGERVRAARRRARRSS